MARDLAGGRPGKMAVYEPGRHCGYMGVSKNRVFLPPKWMVYFMENPIKMDDLGGPPLFLETPIYI